MEYRCEWCGKPHAEDDPPCDACGHGSFERAVVRRGGTVETADPVWACTECGRVHQRNSPPCSRCGNTTLERTDREFTASPDEDGPSYRELASPQYLAAAGVGVAALVVLALAATGLVSLPWLPGDGGGGPPSMPAAPGEGDAVGNVSLEAAERGYVDRLNERRTARGESALAGDETLSRMAEYFNRRVVDARHGDGTDPAVAATQRRFDYRCERRTRALVHRVEPVAATGQSLAAFDSSRAVGAALADAYLELDAAVGSGHEKVGVDVHVAPNGTTYVTLFYC